MANYYIQMSAIMDVDDEEQALWLVNTAAVMQHRYLEEEDDPEYPMPEEVIAVATDQGFDLCDGYLPEIELGKTDDKHHVWIYTEESFSPETLAVLIQAFFRKFDLNKAWGFEYSFTCSKMRTDSWGGGACFVTQDGMDFMLTHHWLADKEEEFYS